nr:biopolymer transporter ExbD [Pantoea sp. BAV 3049]
MQVAVFPAIADRTTQELKPQQKVIRTPGVENVLQLDGKDLPLTSLVERLRQQQKGDEKITIIVNNDKGVPVGRLVEVMNRLRQGSFFSISIAIRKR